VGSRVGSGLIAGVGSGVGSGVVARESTGAGSGVGSAVVSGVRLGCVFSSSAPGRVELYLGIGMTFLGEEVEEASLVGREAPLG
jgi:ABC-type Mn2+/Zn2+ transport system permease subunit